MPLLAQAPTKARQRPSAAPAPEVSTNTKSDRNFGLPLFLQRQAMDSAGALFVQRQPEALPDEEEEEISEVQTKLLVNQPGDAFEQEADQVADRVMRMPESQAGGNASALLEEEEIASSGGGTIQRKSTENGRTSGGAAAVASVHSPATGAPLAPSVRRRVEPVLGADLSDVQVHDDTAAQKAARALNAKAFTHGHNIWLGAHQSREDVPLLAHEATHVVQQDGLLRRKPLDGQPSVAAAPAPPSPAAPPGPASAPTSATPARTSEAAAGGPEAGVPTSAAASVTPVTANAAAEAAAAPPSPVAEPVELLMSEPPEGLSEIERERIEGVQENAAMAAEGTADLPPGEENVAEARGAVEEPESETNARAENALVEALGERPAPSPEIEELCQRIYAVIRSKRPPDEESLVQANPEEMARAAGGELNSAVEGDTQRVQGEYDSLSETPAGTPQQQPEEMESPAETAEMPNLDAAAATPEGVSEEQVDLGPDAAASRQRMEDAGMNSEPAQLVETGPIAEARAAQGELEETAQRAPTEVLAEQRSVLAGAEANMASLEAAALEALTASRRETVGQTVGQQQAMVGSEGQTREQVAAQAQQIFADAQNRVSTLLEPLSRTAMEKWEAGVQVLSTQFRQDLNRVKAWINERYSGVGGALLEVIETVIGMPDWVVEEYNSAEQAFGDGVCELIREISTEVNGIIAAAEAIIEDARTRIGERFDSLPAELQAWAAEQQAQFTERLDGLATQAHETRDNFNRDLTERAAGAVQQVREEVHALRQAAGGLLGQIEDAINAFLEDPAKFIIEGLLQILGIAPAAFWSVVNRIGEAIDSIAEDPMNFANNLLAALGQGFQQFFDKIADHLLSGLLDWLFSALGSVGVQIPSDFSLRSVITFFLQLMGITWPRIRELLAKHIGEENVALIEKAYEIVATLIEMGPEGIFEMLKEQLDPQNILDMVLQAAIDYVKSALIAAVTPRIIALFNPAGAIIQGIEAIYRVLMWVFNNAARIFSLVETVVSGVMDLIAGNIGGMANAVEQGLARLIAPVIDFLAGYIGLGDLPEKIADLIRGLQDWVYGILDRVIGFLANQARALLSALGLGEDSEDEVDEEDPERADQIRAGFADVDAAEQQAVEGGKLSREEAVQIAANVKQSHPVFTSLEVVDGGDTWDYRWEASPGDTKKGEEKEEEGSLDLNAVQNEARAAINEVRELINQGEEHVRRDYEHTLDSLESEYDKAVEGAVDEDLAELAAGEFASIAEQAREAAEEIRRRLPEAEPVAEDEEIDPETQVRIDARVRQIGRTARTELAGIDGGPALLRKHDDIETTSDVKGASLRQEAALALELHRTRDDIPDNEVLHMGREFTRGGHVREEGASARAATELDVETRGGQYEVKTGFGQRPELTQSERDQLRTQLRIARDQGREHVVVSTLPVSEAIEQEIAGIGEEMGVPTRIRPGAAVTLLYDLEELEEPH